MAEADRVFSGNIPELYERHMVPMLFAPYAKDLAARMRDLAPRAILELAAGTGAVTRAVAAELTNGSTLIATDLNPPMLERAQTLVPSSHVRWQQADAQALPFDEGQFDAVICQFGVMFFPDKLGAYRQVHRTLRPGGSYVFNVWDRLNTNDFVAVAQEALGKRFADDPPLFMQRTPHGYHDTKTIEDQVREAGFSSVRIETLKKISRAVSPLAAATGYCQSNPLRNEIEERAPGELQAVTELVAEALASHFGTGEIEGSICAHVVTAVK